MKYGSGSWKSFIMLCSPFSGAFFCQLHTKPQWSLCYHSSLPIWVSVNVNTTNSPSVFVSESCLPVDVKGALSSVFVPTAPC